MALTDNLISYWKLEEASGSRADSVGANTLTDNNTVTQAAGKIGNAALFTAASSEYLSIADNAALSTGDISYTWTLWAYFTSLATEQWLVCKSNDVTDAAREYVIRNNALAANQIDVSMDSSGGARNNLGATTFGNISTATWYFIVMKYDATANILYVGVNNVFNSVSASPGPADQAYPFYLGCSRSVGNFFGGRLDEVGFWKRALTTTELDFLYNGGAGRAYPFAIGPIQELSPIGSIRQVVSSAALVRASTR